VTKHSESWFVLIEVDIGISCFLERHLGLASPVEGHTKPEIRNCYWLAELRAGCNIWDVMTWRGEASLWLFLSGSSDLFPFTRHWHETRHVSGAVTIPFLSYQFRIAAKDYYEQVFLWSSSAPSSECSHSRPTLKYGTVEKSMETCSTITYHNKNAT
jgi:hypothetical protein